MENKDLHRDEKPPGPTGGEAADRDTLSMQELPDQLHALKIANANQQPTNLGTPTGQASTPSQVVAQKKGIGPSEGAAVGDLDGNYLQNKGIVAEKCPSSPNLLCTPPWHGTTSVEDEDCCSCQACVCPCHAGKKSARAESKVLFLQKRFPSAEDKFQLLVEGVTMTLLNAWFASYRHTMFAVLKTNAARNITANNADIELLTTKVTQLAFKHVISRGVTPLHESCFKVTKAYFQAWFDALKAGEDGEKAAREALEEAD